MAIARSSAKPQSWLNASQPKFCRIRLKMLLPQKRKEAVSNFTLDIKMNYVPT